MAYIQHFIKSNMNGYLSNADFQIFSDFALTQKTAVYASWCVVAYSLAI